MNIIEDFQIEFQRRGWTQTEWAVSTGIPQSTISRWLDGGCDPRYSNLKRLVPFIYTQQAGLTSPTAVVTNGANNGR